MKCPLSMLKRLLKIYQVKIQKLNFLLAILPMLFANNSVCQSIQNFKVYQVDDSVKINYDITGGRRDDVFIVSLDVSDDGGASFLINPLTIRGDIGYGIKSGQNKKILWQPLKDSLELDGDRYLFSLKCKIVGTPNSIDFTDIKGGEFIMGDIFEEGKTDEMNKHLVKLNDFEMSINEITNVQYAYFLNAYGSELVKSGEYKGKPLIYENNNGLFKSDVNTTGGKLWKVKEGFDYYPVVNVTWYGANEFCNFYGYRLPTEAEWEYAARSMGDTIRFADDKNICDPKEINFNSSIDSLYKYLKKGLSVHKLTRVAAYIPNKLLLFDMSGNVWEWCQDWYASNYYFHSKIQSPTGPWFGKYKVIRGGSWNNSAKNVRNFERSFCPPNYKNTDLGFRVVKDIKNK